MPFNQSNLNLTLTAPVPIIIIYHLYTNENVDTHLSNLTVVNYLYIMLLKPMVE